MQFKIGICQLKVREDQAQNLAAAGKMVREAVAGGAELVLLPEMFNCPYRQDYFQERAETEAEGATVRFLAQTAQENQCYLVGGSVPERDGAKIYNTCFSFDRQGRIIAKHRKLHLFDLEIPGGFSFRESAVLSRGDQITTFDTEFGRWGVAICYDLRFPELFRLMVAEGVVGVLLPAAFNLTTGPAHWETVCRTRAIDNQLFLIGASPARDTQAVYVAYGHSLAVDPWGEILWQAGATETIGLVSLEQERLTQVRRSLPLLEHRRHDLYQVSKPAK